METIKTNDDVVETKEEKQVAPIANDTPCGTEFMKVYVQLAMEHEAAERKALETKVATLEKDLKSSITGTLVAIAFCVVAIGGVLFSTYSQNKVLAEHAEAINNNSYSINSIVDSIQADK